VTDSLVAAAACRRLCSARGLQGELSFDELLDRLRCPVLLLYGKEDPWVR
jgi:hypothetical protein